MDSNYKIISLKLRKYWKKRALRSLINGLLLTLIFALFILLISAVLENIYYLTPQYKKVLLYGDISFFIIVLITMTIIPLLKFLFPDYFIKEKIIIDEISEQSADIKDELINIYELENSKDGNQLLIASINQKISDIKILNFNSLLNFSKSLKLFGVYIVLFATIIFLNFLDVRLLNDPIGRIVHVNKTYEKPSPYKFDILNDSLEIGKGDDFTLECKINSNKEVTEPYIFFGGVRYRLTKDSINFYSYQFKKLNNSVSFRIGVDDYSSIKYQIEVLSYPLLKMFKVAINKPRYTLLDNEVLMNINSFEIPVGSNVQLDFDCLNTDELIIANNDLHWNLIEDDLGIVYGKEVNNNESFYISLKNENFSVNDYLNFDIKVINDEFPYITVEQRVDSINRTMTYFKGEISDDYGFSKLLFHYKYDEIDSVINLDINKYLNEQDYYYGFDFNEIKYLSTNFEYYFEVFDNDGINGSKSTISNSFIFQFPSFKELLDYQDEAFKSITDLGEKSMEKTFDLQEKLEDLKMKLIDEDLSEWEKKEMLEEILNEKKQLEKLINKLEKENSDLESFDQTFTEQDKELVEKQKMIEELLENVMSDEIKELMDEMSKLMEDFKEENFNKLKEEMDMSLDDLSEQLDRNLEMLRKMQIEKKLNLLNDKLKEMLATEEKAMDLFDESKNKDRLIENEKKQQFDLKNFERGLKDVNELNDQLDNKLGIFNLDTELEQISNDFKETINKTNESRRKKIKEQLEKNVDDLNQLSFLMNQMIEANFEEKQGENIEEIMQIQENVLTYSFDQEDILHGVTNREVQSNILVRQRSLEKNFEIIKDSLYALAKREPQVGSMVNKEIVSINNNLFSTIEELKESRGTNAKVYMQNTVTSANNLALFLSDVIRQMNMDMASSKGGCQNCQKPGGKGSKPGGKPSMGNMKSAQEALKKQLEKMMKGMKDGQGTPSASEFGKALSQQEMLNNLMREMINDGSVGSSAKETIKKAQEMLDQVRGDILNKNLTNNTIKRQNAIMTRMLEAENAEMEREKDKKRESENPVEQMISKSAQYFDYTIANDKFDEKYHRNNVILKSFYNKKFKKYLKEIKE